MFVDRWTDLGQVDVMLFEENQHEKGWAKASANVGLAGCTPDQAAIRALNSELALADPLSLVS